MAALVHMLMLLLNLYLWLIIFTVIVSWLVAFGVLNARNPTVYRLCALLNRLTDPVVQRVRRYVPPIGGIDITPMIVIFAIYLLQSLLLMLL